MCVYYTAIHAVYKHSVRFTAMADPGEVRFFSDQRLSSLYKTTNFNAKLTNTVFVFGRPLQVTVRPMLLSVCNVGVLWTNGWMDQDTTWYGGRPRSRPHCVTWASSSREGHRPPIFGPSLLWPKGRPSQLHS